MSKKTSKRTHKAEHIVRKNGSDTWRIQVRYDDENGESKRRYVYGDTEADCLKNAEELKKSRGKQEVTDITVVQAIKDTLNAKEISIKHGTKRNYRAVIRKVQNSFPKVKVGQLDKHKVNAIIKSYYADGCGTVTVKQYLRIIKASCSYCGYDKFPSFKDLSFRTEEIKDNEYPAFKDVVNYVKGTDCEVPCLLSLYCGGMRINEVCGLQYRDFYPRKRGSFNYEVYIHRGRTVVNGREIIQNTLKTRESTRKVPVPDWLYQKVMEQPHESNDEFVFPHHYVTLGNRFKKVMRENGWELTFHALRHIFAITNAKAGVMMNELAILGGWTQGSEVLTGVYLKVSQRDADEGAEKFNNYLATLSN